MTREDLAASLKMLRANGVSRYEDIPGEGFKVEFFPAVAADEPAKPSNDPELCHCGHSLPIHHVNGHCVEGCAAEECAGEQK